MSKPPLPTVGADPAPIGPATPAPGGPANPDRPAAEPAVREVKPTIYYLRDKDGNLVPVPGFSFEDFERLLRLDRKLAVPDTPPRYSLQKFSASGVVEGERAILRIDVTVALRDAEWVRIPLRCETALLREPVSVSGGADSAATFEREGDGYVVWLKGPVDKPQTLSLQVLVPILPVTDGQRLALAVP